jgi:sulfatase maturation enzyme AslB (radical SAM superfamily)
VIIFGAGIVGEVTLQACRAKGLPVECFIDDRVEGFVAGVPITKFADFTNVYVQGVTVYLTSPNIDDMVKPLEKAGFKNWKSCGELIQDFDISTCDWSHHPYSVEHIKYLVRTALHHHDNYLHPEKLTVQSIDLIVTERCSMKCRDCSNLMQYYEKPENADLNEMLTTIDQISERMDEIYEVRVIGGEPFMNKEWHLVVEKLNQQPKVKKVSIFTNATIVPREHQWASLQHEKVRLFVTDYDSLSRNIRPLVEELNKRGIAYVNEKANDWTDCASLEKHNRTVRENEELFDKCCAKNLATLADGRLYRCPFAANADKLSAVPDYPQDYVKVGESTREGISRFLRGKTYIEACDHCNGRSYGDPLITPAIQTVKPLKYFKYARA